MLVNGEILEIFFLVVIVFFSSVLGSMLGDYIARRGR